MPLFRGGLLRSPWVAVFLILLLALASFAAGGATVRSWYAASSESAAAGMEYPAAAPSASGEKSVVVFRVAGPGQKSADEDSVARQLRRSLSWFSAQSSGRLSFSRVDVLPATRVPSTGCQAQRAAFDRAWRSAGLPAGTFVVGLLSASCPWSGLGFSSEEMPRALFSGVSPESLPSAWLVVHEFGHALSVPHARARSCPVRDSAVRGSRCHLVEYGDPFNPMGRALWPGVPDAGPEVREVLGWPVEVRQLPSEALLKVSLPPVGDPGLDAVEFSAGGFDYRLSNRSTGPHRLAGRGVVVHVRPPGASEWFFAPFSASRSYALPGDRVVLPSGTAGFEVLDFKRSSARVLVAVSSHGLADVWSPSLAVSGLAEAGSPVRMRWFSHSDDVARVEYRLPSGSWRDATGSPEVELPARLFAVQSRSDVVFRAFDVAGNARVVRVSFSPRDAVARSKLVAVVPARA